ncbi:MAG TPA: XdhC family protein [Thermoanaerobaculia bacterium]|nr:XdhC family protein [Thermoanaerobaculia bacterium]
MNHWKETAEILARLAELKAAGRRAALATVVEIVGSAYRRPGAKLLIEEAGGTLGSVSGGCLEADVREVAQAVVDSGVPSLRHYNTGDDDVVWGLGLGCNGLVDVFVQPATEGPLAALAGRLGELFAGEAALALATVLAPRDPGEPGDAGDAGNGLEGAQVGAMLAVELRDAGQVGGDPPAPGPRQSGERANGRAAGDGGKAAGGGSAAPVPKLGGGMAQQRPAGFVHGSLGAPALDRQVAERVRGLVAAGRSGVQEIAGRRVFVDMLPPPPHLVICGAGDDARPLVAYAADVGFRVTLVDHRPALLAPEWFPQAARRVVARPEDPDLVLPAAERALAVVKTHSLAHDREWVRRLLAAGYPYVGVLGPRGRTEAILRDVHGSEREGVFGPVGLDLGADGPRQVAISIVAELLAFTAQREPRHLSARREAIHAG